MSTSDRRGNADDESPESEPDEDPKLMLLVEAGLVPGLDADLKHLQHRFKKKKKKKHVKKNLRKRKHPEGDPRHSKWYKRDFLHEHEYVISRIVTHLNKPLKYEAYQNSLTMSEWFVKVPDDFEENWITVSCPPGRRMLVVAASGSTRSFAKSGDFMFFFQSVLPGGHIVNKDESSRSLTILDCIWNHKNQTYYVLDVLCWNNSHLLYCEAKFRFFWLEQKFLELGTNLNESGDNHYRFSNLPRVQCKRDGLVEALTSVCRQSEFVGNLDGFLFYKMNAPYFAGVSSAVGWLKPFMVPDVFDVPSSPQLMLERPAEFVSVEHYIKEFEENKKQIIKRERKIRMQKYAERYKESNVKEEVSNDVVMQVDAEETVVEKEKLENEKMESSEVIECT